MKFIFAHPHLAVFFIAWFLIDRFIPLIMYITNKFNILDIPSRRKVHLKPVPLLGGLGIYFAFLLSILSTLEFNETLILILMTGTIIIIVGVLDDIIDVSAKIKLLVLFLITFLLAEYGLVIHFVPVVLQFIITVLWISYVASCFNAIDNMDGVATTSAFISSFFFYLISYITDQPWMGYVAVALAGSCWGFLTYNFNPAKIFMGDSGSFFIGFMLACISLMGEWGKDNQWIKALLVPPIILMFPIFDLFITTVLRYKYKQVKTLKEAITMSAKDHITHRLSQRLSLGQKGITIIVACLTFIFGACGLLIQIIEVKYIFIAIISIAIFLIIFSLYLDSIKINYEN